MAITGNFLSSNSYSGAAKWGTGINPIHGLVFNADKLGEVHTAQGPGGQGDQAMPEQLLDLAVPEYGYTDEDFSSGTWGYGLSTGTADRPASDVESGQFRGSTPPAWPAGPDESPGPPAGTTIRSVSHGDTITAKLGDKEETVGEGWVNKQVGGVIDAVDADPSQVYMQTSMTQRDKVRAGSQAQPGRASEQTAPIGSWRPTWGVRIKPWSGGRRHYDMFPRQQDQIIRPFWYRQAGTGYVEQMAANEAYNYQVKPLQRQPVPDPYAGVQIPASGNVYQQEASDVSNWVNVWY